MSGYADPPKATRFKPGESGNPQGRPVGRRSLSRIIKDLLENELDFSKLDTNDAAKLAAAYKGKSAWEALVYVAFIKAASGDIRASDWLARNAYGTRQIIEADPPLLPNNFVTEAIAHQLQIQEAGQRVLAAENEVAA